MTANQRRISSKVRQFVTAACLTAIVNAAAWAAQVGGAPTPVPPTLVPPTLVPPTLVPPTLVVPGYGTGIAGQITEGPTAPVCRVNMPCIKPFADAAVLMLDRTNRNTVGAAVTNTGGNFVVTVPPGAYLVHVQTVDFLRCHEVPATVGQSDFTLVQIICDTGIR